MIENVGRADRIARIVIGLLLIVAPLLNMPPIWSAGSWAYAAMIVGAVLAVTGFVKMCPLYRLLGVNTCGT